MRTRTHTPPPAGIGHQPPADADAEGRSWLRRASAWLLPSRCLLCGAPGDGGRDLCRHCAAALPWNDACCGRCGLPLPQPEPTCGACLRRPPAYDACRAVFRYAAPLDQLLPRLKFHGDLAAGAVVADLLAAPLAAACAATGRPAVLVPVPLHRSRLARRGYNQAQELARPLARRLQVPLAPALLVRSRATEAQTGLDAAGRRGNVRHAFTATGPVPAHVALLDDTMATGATVEECARALRQAGARRIDVWVAARAA